MIRETRIPEDGIGDVKRLYSLFKLTIKVFLTNAL